MSSDPKLDANYRDLCVAAGHLFIMFARLEGTLSAALKLHLANRMSQDDPDPETAALPSAIYGSMRFKSARDAMKRIMTTEATPAAAQVFVLSTFEQIGHIEDLRDKIAHHQVVPAYEGAEGYWQVTDAVVTRDVRNPRVWVFDVDAVANAAMDLVQAGKRLGGHRVGSRLFVSPEFETAPATWLYKPSMLKLVSRNKATSPLTPSRSR